MDAYQEREALKLGVGDDPPGKFIRKYGLEPEYVVIVRVLIERGHPDCCILFFLTCWQQLVLEQASPARHFALAGRENLKSFGDRRRLRK
jgi:hypothetical protein